MQIAPFYVIMMIMKLTILVPVYYEQDNILQLFAEISEQIKTTHELLVVYDDPQDPTYDVVKQYLKTSGDNHIRLVQNSVNGGRGALNALKTGFQEAKGEAILVVMADLSDDLAVADQMFALQQAGSVVVCASRYMKGGHQIGGPLLKRILSQLAGVSLYYVRGVPTHDISNNYRLYDRAFLQSLTLESEGGFEIAMEITVKAFKAKQTISEVPATWHDRLEGKSNFKLWKWLPAYLRWYLYALF
jgi:dolichol-phosphate mannosyltransferase